MTSKVLTLTKSKSLSTMASRKRTLTPENKEETAPKEVEPVVKKPKVELKASSFGLKRLHSTINISADKWLLTMDSESISKLEFPPSLADGLDRETEKDLRYLGCEVIQSGAILLRLPQVAAATAQILYQRYFYQRSFVRHSWEYIAMACLLLASKIEEAPRRPRDIINVFHRLEYLHGKRTESKEYVPMLLDSKYVNLKNQVIKAERKLLNVLGFVVHVNHPHKLIYAYLNALLFLDNYELTQKAWNYMNDGLRTDIFLRYRPETIACACIFLAARTISKPVSLPQVPFPWYEAFDASDRDVRTISLILLGVYRRVRAPNWLRLNDALNKFRDIPSSTDIKNGEIKATNPVSSELEKKRRELVAKADEMCKLQNGISKSKKSPRRNSESEQSSEKNRSRSSSESSSVTSTESKRQRGTSLISETKGSSDRVKRRHHKHRHRAGKKHDKDGRQDIRAHDRRGSQNRDERQESRSRDDRIGIYGRDERRRSHSKDRRRRRSRSRDRRQRSRSREERNRILRDRLSNQRERERDVFKVLGKRPQGSESPERPSKQRR